MSAKKEEQVSQVGRKFGDDAYEIEQAVKAVGHLQEAAENVVAVQKEASGKQTGSLFSKESSSTDIAGLAGDLSELHQAMRQAVSGLTPSTPQSTPGCAKNSTKSGDEESDKPDSH